MDNSQCPHAEKSDTLILCDCDPEETGASAAWRTKDGGKIITMPFFCLNKCAYHKKAREGENKGR